MKTLHRNNAWSYDAIADLYATDMGQNMPFNDVGWYRSLCLDHGGRTLELGCGTGRILLELLAAGIDAVGIDRSLPMLQRLQRDAISRHIPPCVVQMDLTELGFDVRFRTILAPYSLITYLVDPTVAVAVLVHLREMLTQDGCVVLDAFLPRPVTDFSEFRFDYRRPHDGGALERYKRIATNSDGTNRIERRYCSYAADGSLREEFCTDETIRPYTPDAIAALADAAGFYVEKWIFNYGASNHDHAAGFATAILHPRVKAMNP